MCGGSTPELLVMLGDMHEKIIFSSCFSTSEKALASRF
jgi:hypothetical protein